MVSIDELKKSSKTWYVSCSPRSPEKIAPELKLMTEVEGLIWDGVYTKKHHKELGFSDDTFSQKKDAFENQKNQNQSKIAKKLANLDAFKGKTYEKEENFSIRDRVAPMKTYGFVYTNSNHKLIITPAGKMIIADKRPKEIFLKQFLKWQYPSYQHGTARPHPGKYPISQFTIFPFVATLDLIFHLEGLTKYEIAIFALTTRKFEELESVKTKIKKFRAELSKITGKNPRKQFIYNYHYERFMNIYKDEFDIGKKIREGKTGEGLIRYINTKMNNSYDVADSSIRYFRYSGLLSSKGNRVIILNDRKEDVIDILKRDYPIHPYSDVDNFYNYYGNFKKPILKYEDSEILIERISKSYKKSQNVLAEIKKVNPNTNRTLISFSQLDVKNIEELKDIYYEIIQNLMLLNRDALVLSLQNSKSIEELIIPDLGIFIKSNTEINEDVANKFIVDKNSVFEFVIWRAMVALGAASEYKNNFLIDEELNIIHHAAGNQGDMEIYYEDFTLLVEVTTSSGVTQFNMEKEPVTRHYENLKKKTNIPTYCLFVAKQINENTYKEFLRYNHIKGAKIVPLELKDFIMIIKKQATLLKNNYCISSAEIKDLFDKMLNIKDIKTYEKWKKSINKELKKYVAI